jgi:hypothetical protein
MLDTMGNSGHGGPGLNRLFGAAEGLAMWDEEVERPHDEEWARKPIGRDQDLQVSSLNVATRTHASLRNHANFIAQRGPGEPFGVLASREPGCFFTLDKQQHAARNAASKRALEC